MTDFQRYCKRNPGNILDNVFKKYQEYYPSKSVKQAKEDFKYQINELFFNRCPR